MWLKTKLLAGITTKGRNTTCMRNKRIRPQSGIPALRTYTEMRSSHITLKPVGFTFENPKNQQT